MKSNIYILDGYMEEFSSISELNSFISDNAIDDTRELRGTFIDTNSNTMNRFCINNHICHSCSIIGKINLCPNSIYYSEGTSEISKDIRDLIGKGINDIIIFNPNTNHNKEIYEFEGTNKEAALKLSKYARFRHIWVYENNIIEEFELDSCNIIIDYNFIFGKPFNIYDKVYTKQYNKNLIVGFYTTSYLGSNPHNYSRDIILNAKFNASVDLDLRYCMMDEEYDEINSFFDSSQFILQ